LSWRAPPAGLAEPGRGGVWLPALRSVRAVLQLGAGDEDRVPGQPLPRPAWLLLSLFGMVMAAATVGVNTRIIPALSAAAGPASALALGAATGIALIVVELAVLHGILRRTLVPFIGRFVEGLETPLKAGSSGKSQG
jgi:hypothetical protein